MGLSRSTFYDKSAVWFDEDELVSSTGAICDEFECYGYRWVGAALRPCCTDQRGWHSYPQPVWVQAMRTETRRPSSSIRFRA